MLVGEVVSILVSGVIGIFVSGGISKPIHQLTNVITQTAQLDFKPTADGSKLRKQKDEIGVMAREIHQMRRILKGMVEQMNETERAIHENANNLGSENEKDNREN